MIYSAEVCRVIDGDTLEALIDLGFGIYIKRKVRIRGINTAELKAENTVEKLLALEAKNALTGIIGEKYIKLSNISTDKYGRILADVSVDGGQSNVSDYLIKSKLAVKYDGVGKPHTVSDSIG